MNSKLDIVYFQIYPRYIPFWFKVGTKYYFSFVGNGKQTMIFLQKKKKFVGSKFTRRLETRRIITAAGSLSCIFFSKTKIPISAVRFWHRSTGKMADSPHPAARSPRPGCPSNALYLTGWGMPYSLLAQFSPLPFH